MLLGGKDGILRLWTLKLGAEVKQFKNGSDEINCVAVSKDGSTVAVGASNQIRVYKKKAVSDYKQEDD